MRALVRENLVTPKYVELLDLYQIIYDEVDYL